MVPAERSLPELAASSCTNVPNEGCFKPELGACGPLQCSKCSGSTGMSGTAHHLSHQGKYCAALELI